MNKEKHYKKISEHISWWYGILLPAKDIEEVMNILEKEKPYYWDEEYKKSFIKN